MKPTRSFFNIIKLYIWLIEVFVIHISFQICLTSEFNTKELMIQLWGTLTNVLHKTTNTYVHTFQIRLLVHKPTITSHFNSQHIINILNYWSLFIFLKNNSTFVNNQVHVNISWIVNDNGNYLNNLATLSI